MAGSERVYYVTHRARVYVTTVVVARSAKEAVQKDRTGEHAGEGWAGDAEPYTQSVARWARDEKPEDYR